MGCEQVFEKLTFERMDALRKEIRELRELGEVQVGKNSIAN